MIAAAIPLTASAALRSGGAVSTLIPGHPSIPLGRVMRIGAFRAMVASPHIFPTEAMLDLILPSLGRGSRRAPLVHSGGVRPCPGTLAASRVTAYGVAPLLTGTLPLAVGA